MLPVISWCAPPQVIQQHSFSQSISFVLLQAAAREDEGQQWLIVGKSGQQKLQVDGKQVDVWVSGIRPKLDTPLAWLHSQLRHPDYFLYVVLHVY